MPACAQPRAGEPDDALKSQRRELGIKLRGAPAPAPLEGLAHEGLPSAGVSGGSAAHTSRLNAVKARLRTSGARELCGVS